MQPQHQQSSYEPETPLLFNTAPGVQAGGAAAPTLARVLHFEQHRDDEQQEQVSKHDEQPATPVLVGSALHGSQGGQTEAEGPNGLTPIQDVISMMRSPAQPMPMGLDD